MSSKYDKASDSSPHAPSENETAQWASYYSRNPANEKKEKDSRYRPSEQYQMEYSNDYSSPESGSTERFSKAYKAAHPRIVIYEDISADTQADSILENNSDSQDLISPPSTPPPILEQHLSPVGRGSRRLKSSKEPSTVIENPSEREGSLREGHSLSSSYRPREDDIRMTGEKRFRDFDVMGSQQGKGAKVTRRGKACASCRGIRIVVISLP